MSYFNGVCIPSSRVVPAQQEEAISSQLINAALLTMSNFNLNYSFVCP